MSTIATLGRPKRPRRFAPLDPSKPNEHNAPKLRGIIFDVDGTLCLPQNYMFREMRAALSIPKSVDILEHLLSLPSTTDSEDQSSQQSRATETIRQIERNAMTSQTPQPGLTSLMSYLTASALPKGLCTRNFPAPVQHLLDKYLPHETFDMIITRETKGVAPKPSPEGLWAIARMWQTADPSWPSIPLSESNDPLAVARETLGSSIIMVGDSMDDMAAGYRAGAATVLLLSDHNLEDADHEYIDMSINRLDELIELLSSGFEGRS